MITKQMLFSILIVGFIGNEVSADQLFTMNVNPDKFEESLPTTCSDATQLICKIGSKEYKTHELSVLREALTNDRFNETIRSLTKDGSTDLLVETINAIIARDGEIPCVLCENNKIILHSKNIDDCARYTEKQK